MTDYVNQSPQSEHEGVDIKVLRIAKIACPKMVRSVSDMAKAQDEQIPLRFEAMSDTPAIEVDR